MPPGKCPSIALGEMRRASPVRRGRNVLLLQVVRLHGRLRPLPPGEHEIALSRLSAAFPATARDFTRLGDKVLLVFAPDQTP